MVKYNKKTEKDYMKAFVLCGGVGGRMKPLSYYIHKSMLPLKDGRPLIEHITDYLLSFGFEPIIALSKGNHEKQVTAFLGPKFQYSISPEPMGTAGEFLYAYHQNIITPNDKNVLIYYGDTLTDLDLKKMYQHHKSDNFLATLCGKKGLQSEYGILKGKDGIITKLQEKPIIDCLINCPVFYVNNRIIKYMAYGRDFMKHTFPYAMRFDEKFGLYIHDGKYVDIGRITDYADEVGLK